MILLRFLRKEGSYRFIFDNRFRSWFELSCDLQTFSTVGSGSNSSNFIPNRFSDLAFSDSESDEAAAYADADDDNDDGYIIAIAKINSGVDEMITYCKSLQMGAEVKHMTFEDASLSSQQVSQLLRLQSDE